MRRRYRFTVTQIKLVVAWRLQPRSQGLFHDLNAGRERLKADPSFGTFDYANLTNLLHPGFQGVRWTCDQPMPAPFVAPPPSQGKGPGNEVVKTRLETEAQGNSKWPFSTKHIHNTFYNTVLTLTSFSIDIKRATRRHYRYHKTYAFRRSDLKPSENSRQRRGDCISCSFQPQVLKQEK